jgi:hypothetical protein
MTDDLSKYEALAGKMREHLFAGNGYTIDQGADAILELVAMVQEAREVADKYAESSVALARESDARKERAEAAEDENAKLRELLKPFADMWGYTDEDVKRARAALGNDER